MVYDYLQAEVTLGRILGPLSPPPDGLVVSKFGVIPKKHEVGKWCLILDLSSPEGASVNDDISKIYAMSSTRALTKQPSLSWRRGSGPCC